MNTEIFLNSTEVACTLPVLERILNGIATERVRTHYAGIESPFARPVYLERRFDEEMFGHILSCRNKLKRIGSSRKLRLNCFELAALALALRVSLKEKPLQQELCLARCIARLAQKLETLRKRAKRVWTRRNGKESFLASSLRWKRFVEWLRFEILAPNQRRELPRAAIPKLQREEREYMRAIALTVASTTASTEDLKHLADLARREAKRRRHSFGMRELLHDESKAQRFLADFILKRLGLPALKPEYQPRCFRAGSIVKGLQASLTIANPNPKLQATLAE